MQAAYPASYHDDHGEVATTIENNGKSLRMSLFGIELEGNHFGSFEPVRWSNQAQLSRFSFALVGEEALKGITADELQRLFGTSPDDPMYAEYPARAPHIPRLQQCVNHHIDLNAFEYFVGAFQEDGS